MAISEACKYEIEESVDKACEEKGIPKAEAFTALQTFYNGIGVPITFGAIKTKYYRAHKEVSNETPPQTPENTTKATDEMDEKIICVQCNERIAVRRKKNGEWYYTSVLCEGCRNEANGKPRIRSTTSQPPKKKDDLEKAIQEAETINIIGNVAYLSNSVIAQLEGVPKSDPGRIKQYREVFCWIKNIFEMEGIEHGC